MMIVMFSLNKWEMLYNGTGWAHFLAFVVLLGIMPCLTRYMKKASGMQKRSELVLLFVLPL